YNDDLKRRMTLRPGSTLEADQTARAIQLTNEAERLMQHLRSEGFYDAHATVGLIRKAPYEVKLQVKVALGPPYYVGRITVSGNTAISTADIDRVFRHSLNCFIVCFGEARFTRAQLNRDVDTVTEMYQRRGFPGVRVSTDFDVRYSFDRINKTVNF